MNMDPLPWVRCVRELLDSFSPSFLSLPIPNVCFGRRQPPSSQCWYVFVWICTARNWRYRVFLMPASGSYTRHALWCEIVGGREQPRWIEGEAEGVESEGDGGGRGLCFQRELSKDNPSTSVEKCCSLMLRLDGWKRKCDSVCVCVLGGFCFLTFLETKLLFVNLIDRLFDPLDYVNNHWNKKRQREKWWGDKD